MKIVLVGPFFANEKHGSERGVFNALVELGHDVSAWDPRTKEYFYKGVKVPIGQISHIPADLVLCLGPGVQQDVLNSDLWRNLKCLKALWSSEPIRLPQYRDKIITQKGQFGHYFSFDESEIPLYHDLGIWSVDWLAQAFNPEWYKPLDNVLCNQQFCFVGSIGGKWCNREYFINRVAKWCENRRNTQNLATSLNVGTNFDAQIVNQLYNVHEVVLNLGLYLGGSIELLKSSGLQQRIFEAIGAGRVVVTNEISSDTNKLFTNNEHLLYYNTGNLERILDYSLLPSTQRHIRQNVLKIREYHTYEARMIQMLDILGG